MGKKLRGVLAVLLIVSIAITGCKKKEKDTIENDMITKENNLENNTVNQEESNTAEINGNSTNSGDIGGHVISVNDNGGQKLSAPALTGVVKAPADGIGVAGVDYIELKTGPDTDWGDMKIPYFNPLGSKQLYDGGNVSYDARGGLKLEVLNNYFINTFKVEGEYWRLRIQDPDFKVYWLNAYAKKLGATIYETSGDSAVYEVRENETTKYWIEAELSQGGCYLYIVRNDMAPAGKTLTFNTADIKGDTVSFYSDCVKGKLQSVTVTVKGPENSGVRLNCINDRTYGIYTRLMRKEFGNAEQINTKKTDTFVFDDVPVMEGQLYWTFNWASLRGTLKPTEVTFKIENTAEVEPVKYGEQLGMLRVVGVPMGEVEILPGDSVDMRHPDFDAGYIIGTRDKDSNTVFSLPAGYYSVRFSSSQRWGRKEGPVLGGIDAPGVMRLIPVNAGEITTVTIPRETQLTYGLLQKQYGTFETAGNVEITDNKDNGDTAIVSIVVNDPLERDIFPEKEDITITENGLKAKVTEIKRETAPADVVLVLDTSGSMGNNMEAAVEAAKKFIDSLPDNTNIRFVQFEQKITKHEADTKKEVITALGKVKANGGTAMYDATDSALKLLSGKKKPYVILFSDGADSRELKNMGKGSTLTKSQILTKIKESSATVLTIGFGEGHDPRVLVEMSNASNDGAYFAAMEPEALDQAFAAVSGKFGNQFVITYERPTAVKDRDSDIPVVAFMIDRSGSMDMDPAESKEDVDYRIDIVKKLFHDYVCKLPQGTLMQLGSFRTPPTQDPHIYFDQITTDQKASVLQGIGQFEAGGGTPIVPALTTAYSYLTTIPSSKKTLIYFTDAALAGEDETEKVQLEGILLKMKKEGFHILFAGLGNDKFAQLYDEAFSKAAELSGGEYIITDHIDDIEKKLNELMNRIDQPTADHNIMDFTISLNCLADDGSRMDYGAQKQVEDFSERVTTGEVIKPELVKITTGEVYSTYNREASMLVYGSDRPNEDSTVLEYIPYEKESASAGSFTSENKEMKLTVREAYYMNPFKGIELRNQQQFLVLGVELSLAEGAPIKEYQIPSIFRHFYVSLNDVLAPASQATWLAQTPLSPPGDPSVTIKGMDKISGALVFMVNRKLGQRVDQLSLHFYDMSYGHISIPMVGSIPEYITDISDLPTAAPAKLSDTFSLTVNGKQEQTELAGISIYQDGGEKQARNTTFRVLEGEFQSNMQALLNIDPTERFLYAIETDQGPLVTKMSDVVYNIPMGFTGSTMLAPAAAEPVRMPFQLPLKLAGNSSYLFADLATGGVNIPVTTGSPLKTGGLGIKYSHEYFDLTVNALRRVSKNDTNTVVLDFTVTDKKDGFGLKDLAGMMALAKSGASAESTKYFGDNIAVGRNGIGKLDGRYNGNNVIPVHNDTNELLYSASQDWAVLDGASRRGILLFDLPNGTDINEWKLNCGVIENMSQPIESSYYEHPELLAKKQYVERDTTVEKQIREAVTAAVAKYQSTRTEANSYTTIGLSPEENVGRQSITPALSIHGRKVLDSIATEEDFLQVMYALFLIPNGDAYQNQFAPEAVITQGWGTELDLARVALDMLSRLGYQPQVITVKLTKAGLENVERITGISTAESMPGIAYLDSQNKLKVFVIPFMRDISELNGLAYIANIDIYDDNFTSRMNRVYITAHAEIIKQQDGGLPQVEAFNSLNSMFGGEGDSSADQKVYEDIVLFDRELSSTELSLDAVDISFSPIGKSADGLHEIIAALVDTKQGVLYNDKYYIDTSFYNIKSVTITIDGYSDVTHTTYLAEGQKLSNVFQTMAYQLPGMTKTAANTLQEAVNAKADRGKDAGDYATVKWLGHATVNKFVRELTAFGEENMPLFGIKAAYVDGYPLSLIVTMVSDGSKADATVDIMQHEIKMLNNPEKKMRDAFSTTLGFFVSTLEAYALEEDGAIGILQVWTGLPANTPIFMIPKEYMESFAKEFEAAGAPPKLVERLRAQAKESAKSMFLVPKSPAVIDGKPRYAWLEMVESNNGTQIISVSETGEHSAMAEYIMLNASSVGVKPLSAEGVAGFLYGITCIDWGIAAYSLQTDNYAAILAQTKVLVGGIQEKLANIETAGDITSKFGEGLTDPQKMIEALEATYKAILSTGDQVVQLDKIHEASKNLVLVPSFEESDWKKNDFAGGVQGYSFSDGFQAAIDAYFKK